MQSPHPEFFLPSDITPLAFASNAGYTSAETEGPRHHQPLFRTRKTFIGSRGCLKQKQRHISVCTSGVSVWVTPWSLDLQLSFWSLWGINCGATGSWVSLFHAPTLNTLTSSSTFLFDLFFFFSSCFYQKVERAKPANLLTKLCFFSRPSSHISAVNVTVLCEVRPKAEESFEHGEYNSETT
jgi:hypothetical protein